jgi:hypothetical protein
MFSYFIIFTYFMHIHVLSFTILMRQVLMMCINMSEILMWWWQEMAKKTFYMIFVLNLFHIVSNSTYKTLLQVFRSMIVLPNIVAMTRVVILDV